MHGHKRSDYKARFANPKVAAGLAQKAQQWNALSDKALALRDVMNPSATEETLHHLTLLEKLLRVNPDPLHLWNHRRLLLLGRKQEDWRSGELALTQAGLEKNPKAYGAWFHRKWVLQQQQVGSSSTTTIQLLSTELALTEQFLQRDERNFHCWNYRRFLVGLELGGNHNSGEWLVPTGGDGVVVGPQLLLLQSNEDHHTAVATDDNTTQEILQREWDFTKTKIVQNFSNFSAFHYRSKLLLLVDDDTKGGWSPTLKNDESDTLLLTVYQRIAESEWKDLMENIMFTEPDDQTIWWYHRFVLDWIPAKEGDWYTAWLQTQAETLQVLVEDTNEESGGCKWALLGYHLVLSRLIATSAGSLEQIQEWEAQLATILDQLLVVDPDRAQRYQTMRRT